ncbi:MAG: nicotinate (nicotinamide) nucleotide adenylyltransferase [Chloroflexi bacterium RBG_16_51_9]|nr:MAG: nicotinate (nicotinamide) nucleotide adenylyltransferase [Chloroflexi bacterium RBG_16_51_9]
MSGSGSKVKIGVLGGTFDPIHKGHLAIAEAAMKRLGLDEVYFVPSARTPLKESDTILAAEHRVKMVRLAIAGYPYFKLSTIEIDRPGPSYTVDTIAQLRDSLGADNELYFIIGLDSLVQLPRWREVARIIQMCQLVAVPRPGYSLPDKDSLEAVIPGISQRLIILDEPKMDISATEIRQLAKRGESISHLVPEAVAEYIKKNKLYLK